MYVHICVGGFCVCMPQFACGDPRTSWEELILAFHHMGLGSGRQVIRLGHVHLVIRCAILAAQIPVTGVL